MRDSVETESSHEVTSVCVSSPGEAILEGTFYVKIQLLWGHLVLAGTSCLSRLNLFEVVIRREVRKKFG